MKTTLKTNINPVAASRRPRLPRQITTFARALVLAIGFAGTALAAEALTPRELPITVQGLSGGSQSTANCGAIDAVPHADIHLDSATYLKLTVNGGSNPTLYIEGPLNLCILHDKTAPTGLQTAGRWPAGDYRVFVGEKDNARDSITLNIQGSGTP